MKKDALKRSFDLTSFESLTVSGDELKGGFSLAYAGATGSGVGINLGKQCACTFSANCVAGCACCPDPKPAES